MNPDTVKVTSQGPFAPGEATTVKLLFQTQRHGAFPVEIEIPPGAPGKDGQNGGGGPTAMQSLALTEDGQTTTSDGVQDGALMALEVFPSTLNVPSDTGIRSAAVYLDDFTDRGGARDDMMALATLQQLRLWARTHQRLMRLKAAQFLKETSHA
ncbi:hypothetical protein E3E11_06500 [Oecophyllibacter saccharovorans]|uniref:hypothetical protein n=1 Tax=Oecophyllibacter saccharovorans TaxID=2558360 RepID=UPI0011430E90|nr:hypothetical protein [Oecophyllibacter saccharovorans]QDH15554.1 hypothetical protein E3E11_06500 [Oecophyllibacter saccharovorans]